MYRVILEAGKWMSNGKNAKEIEKQHDQSTDDDDECDEHKTKSVTKV